MTNPRAGWVWTGLLALTAGACGESGSAGSGDRARPSRTEGCTAPVEDAATGTVRCAEGLVHRVSAKVCAGAAAAPQAPRASGIEECTNDARACDRFAYGYCGARSDASMRSFCQSGCVSDDECGEGFACWCDEVAPNIPGRCVPAQCRVDADCGGERRCLRSRSGCQSVVFACESEQDECRVDADCDDHCSYVFQNASGARSCYAGGCERGP